MVLGWPKLDRTLVETNKITLTPYNHVNTHVASWGYTFKTVNVSV